MELNGSSSSQEFALIDMLKKMLVMGRKFIANGSAKRGQLQMWMLRVRHFLLKIYGTNHELNRLMDPKTIPEKVDVIKFLGEKLNQLESYIFFLENQVDKNFGMGKKGRIFIGHGRSLIWRELKDFLQDRLALGWEEFNREAVAGFTTFERISKMLDSSSFAFLIMTAEDEHADNTTHARQNVVHEVGLFQGRLGPNKAIILLEEGCSEFSNIVGLLQIRFPKGRISAAFEEIRRVLERECIIET